jgi:tetraacyldisaccharide 4'-kinase
MTKKTLRIILFPFSLLYGLIVYIRNFLYDKKVLKSEKVAVPTICIGNLTVGGTGKTPHTEFVLSILKNDWKTAMLSRGYKRKTSGFRLANANSTALEIGDEPLQIYRKFPETTVAVDEKRVRGVNELLLMFPDKLQVIVLDDAFQHRQIACGFSILLTDYSRLYTRDFYLPSGRLREGKSGSKRADVIVVTKCPDDISPTEMLEIQQEINPAENQELFFSSYEYKNLKPVFSEGSEKKLDSIEDFGVLIVAGIVSPQAMVAHLKQYTAHTDTLFFPDHHAFSEKDIAALQKKYNSLNTTEKIIVVTEKDAARLLSVNYPAELKSATFALPIEVKILDNKEKIFIQKIQNYVRKNSRNG